MWASAEWLHFRVVAATFTKSHALFLLFPAIFNFNFRDFVVVSKKICTLWLCGPSLSLFNESVDCCDVVFSVFEACHLDVMSGSHQAHCKHHSSSENSTITWWNHAKMHLRQVNKLCRARERENRERKSTERKKKPREKSKTKTLVLKLNWSLQDVNSPQSVEPRVEILNSTRIRVAVRIPAKIAKFWVPWRRRTMLAQVMSAGCKRREWTFCFWEEEKKCFSEGEEKKSWK